MKDDSLPFLPPSPSADATDVDRDDFHRLMPLVYEELRLLAHRQRQRSSVAPGTTSLVHEAYLKLEGRTMIRSRGEFFALACQVLRSLLVDNARRLGRRKREGEANAIPLDKIAVPSAVRGEEILALDEALQRLQRADERLARIVECRFFGGLTVDETAEALGVSPATVKRGWDVARAWLYQELAPKS